jgi:acyl-coenzyme A synthetase/AMP-(fatty) acid ligase
MYDFAANGPERTLDWLESEGITKLIGTAGTFRAIFERAAPGRIFPALKVVHLGGERVKGSDFELFRAHTAPPAIFMNSLASSEAGSITTLELGHDAGPQEEF